MRTLILTSTLLLISLAPAAAATTQGCVTQTSAQAHACAFLGTWEGGAADCSTTGSWSAGGAALAGGVGGVQRGAAFDNGCYAYSHDGNPYEGSQVAVRIMSGDANGQQHDGAYLNSGTYHHPSGDHRYCYVAQFDERGEDQDGLRVECPTHVEVPTPLRALP